MCIIIHEVYYFHSINCPLKGNLYLSLKYSIHSSTESKPILLLISSTCFDCNCLLSNQNKNSLFLFSIFISQTFLQAASLNFLACLVRRPVYSCSASPFVIGFFLNCLTVKCFEPSATASIKSFLLKFMSAMIQYV